MFTINTEFTMNCKEFGVKFKFDATSQKDADLKAKRYCNYHSMGGHFFAEPFDAGKDYGFVVAKHNEYID